VRSGYVCEVRRTLSQADGNGDETAEHGRRDDGEDWTPPPRFGFGRNVRELHGDNHPTGQRADPGVGSRLVEQFGELMSDEGMVLQAEPPSRDSKLSHYRSFRSVGIFFRFAASKGGGSPSTVNLKVSHPGSGTTSAERALW
jgi:hypothetical protein